MAKIRILVSLTTNDNDYQIEQAQSAEQAANKLGVNAEIIYANNDAINQSTQILRAILGWGERDGPFPGEGSLSTRSYTEFARSFTEKSNGASRGACKGLVAGQLKGCRSSAIPRGLLRAVVAEW